MANRLLLGQDNSGNQKLRVSQPGINVLTGNVNQMLFDSDEPMVQVVVSGFFSNASGTRNISWPALGFIPFIYTYAPNNSISLNYTSNNTATLRLATSTTTNAYWAVFNIPRD